MTTQDFLIPHAYTYLLVKIGVLMLALLLWFIFTATPVI
jgi:hypothetical protein